MTRIMWTTALLLNACALSADWPAEPTKVPGCSGVGYSLTPKASACQYLDSTRSNYPWERECLLGWRECNAQPSGCQALPGFWVGRVGWYIWVGAELPGGCGPLASDSTINGYGCGQRMIRDQEMTACGAWDSISHRPWVDSIGILCCKVF